MRADFGTRFTMFSRSQKSLSWAENKWLVLCPVGRASAERRGIEFDEEVDRKRAEQSEYWQNEARMACLPRREYLTMG